MGGSHPRTHHYTQHIHTTQPAATLTLSTAVMSQWKHPTKYYCSLLSLSDIK